MRKPVIALAAVAALLLIFFLSPLKRMVHQKLEEHEAFEEGEEDEKENGVEKQLTNWFWARAYPDPYYLNDKYDKAWQQAQAMRQTNPAARGAGTQASAWTSIGPSTGIGGRILTIAIDPTNSNKLFCGSASGGIWKSTDAGAHWSSVATGFQTLGVTSIVINPSNANEIYAGTGEVYRVDSTGTNANPGNTGYNVWKTRGTYGIGIIKSTDGGTTWTRVMNKSTSELFGIQMLRFDAASSSTLYACATDGLYRTTDGGAHWTQLWDVTYVSDVQANGANIVCAVGNFGNTIKGIYKSTNSGANWVKATGVPAYAGMVRMDCLASDPNTIVASVGVSETATTELYRSTNFGTSFTGLSSSGHCSYQTWCAHDVAIFPTNTNKFLFAGVDMYLYTLPSTSATVGTSVHSDIHEIKFDPTNTSTVYVCCDGGIYKSTNAGSAATSPTFTQINTGLAATQFYAPFGVSATHPNVFVGGLQDNGQVVYNGTSWTTVSGVGGDGTACAIDPANDQNMIVSRDARGIYKSTNGGSSASNVGTYWGFSADSRTAFAAPVAYAKSNSSIVYAATDNLHVSTNGGGTWSGNSYSSATNYIDALHKTAITMAVSPTNANKIYVSTSSFAQYDNDVDNLYYTGAPNVLRTTTGNTPFTKINGTGANTLPNRYVMDFAISKTNDDSVFAAIGGFGTAHVYVTGDGGANWTPLPGLLDVPCNSLLIDPVNPQVLYAGTDLGVYVSPNRGATWYDFNVGLWDATMVADIQATSDNMLVAATHGKGAFKSDRYSGILPVTLYSFTGDAQPNSNKLQWKVGQEVNVLRYELERSANGVNYTHIANVTATNAGTYNYEDLLNSNTSYYYRLKTVDRDGTSSYSGIVFLRRTPRAEVQVLGNPFYNNLQIQFSLSLNSQALIDLYAADGKLLRAEEVKLNAGQSVYSTKNVSTLPAGTYFVEVIINNQRWKQKVLKKS